VNASTRLLLAIGLCHLTFANANACKLGLVQKSDLRHGFCVQEMQVEATPGCTSVTMLAQVQDQFKQIALARRCGFNAEADKLQGYYKSTTPFVLDLYQCVDQPIDMGKIEKLAREKIDKHMSTLAAGCPKDLKGQLAKRLPELIKIDEKSLNDVKKLSEQLGLSTK
jgi:hypothetical protein